MTTEEYTNYWIETAEKDYDTMRHLYQTGDYHWALFMGHLVIEKLLKAVYVKIKGNEIPRIHNLSRLCELIELEITEETEDLLDLITTFNINARYPDYKQAFYKKCTKEFTRESIEKIEEVKKWITGILEKK